MAYKRVCLNCGATCEEDRDYCSRCSGRSGFVKEDIMLEKHKVTLWSTFLNKNCDRYLEIFRKNENNKLFLHTNWAAFLAPDYWLHYRRMHILGAVVSILKWLILFAVLILFYHNASYFFEAFVTGSHNEFVEGAEKIQSAAIEGFNMYLSPQDIEQRVQMLAGICSVTLYLAIRFIFSLFADCIYRGFVRRNILKYEVGTSKTGAIAAYFASELVLDIAVVITLIILVLMSMF